METASQVTVAATVTVASKMDVTAAKDSSPKSMTSAPEHSTPHLLMGAATAPSGHLAPHHVMGGVGTGASNQPAMMGQLQHPLGRLQPGMQRVPIYPEPNPVEHLLCCCCLGIFWLPCLIGAYAEPGFCASPISDIFSPQPVVYHDVPITQNMRR